MFPLGIKGTNRLIFHFRNVDLNSIDMRHSI